jgi:hypothetical protein
MSLSSVIQYIKDIQNESDSLSPGKAYKLFRSLNQEERTQLGSFVGDVVEGKIPKTTIIQTFATRYPALDQDGVHDVIADLIDAILDSKNDNPIMSMFL